MTEATYYWSVDDNGIVSFDDTEYTEKESLAFLLVQADAPATTYIHKTLTAQGLAAHIRKVIDND